MIIDGYTAELLINRAIGGTTLEESVKALQDVFVDHDPAEKGEPMRLINADMLMKEYQVKLCCNTDCINCTLFQGDGEECLFDRFVKNAPTIDAVEVVRCKDCKHFHYDMPYVIQGIPVLGHEVCDFWGDGCKTNENGFCSYAERRTDETD